MLITDSLKINKLCKKIRIYISSCRFTLKLLFHKLLYKQIQIALQTTRLNIEWLHAQWGAFISGLIERNDLLRTLVVLINDHLLPGNEIESGGMYTCVKDPAKKGTRGKEDWRGWNEKARGEIEIFARGFALEIQHTLSLLPFSCSGLWRDPPLEEGTFYPVFVSRETIFRVRDLYYLWNS